MIVDKMKKREPSAKNKNVTIEELSIINIILMMMIVKK